MSKVQILTALLLSYLAYSCAEEKPAEKRIDDILRPPLLLKSSAAPPQDTSYFSKISNWLQSFGETPKKTTIIHTSLPPGPPLPPSGPPDSHGLSGPHFPPSGPHHGPSAPSSGPTRLHHSPPGPPLNNPSNNYGPPQTFGSTISHGPPSVGPPPSHSPSIINNLVPSKNINGPVLHNHVSGPGSGLHAQETSNSNKYLPPHPSNNDKDCNPCNKEPWVPIAGHYGSNTLIGFVPNSNNQPSGAYGAPNRPSKEYGPPVPSNQYGPPNNAPPSNQYGPPNNAPSSNQYGPPNLNHAPPSSQYGPPSSSQFSPSPQYGAPPSSHGPPNHGLENLAPPKPSVSYGPPNVGGPSIKYGPPKHKPSFLPTPIPKYGPPRNRRPRPNFLPPPSSFMGPPPTSTKYGPPSNNFGHAASGPSGGFAPPSASSPINSYGPPPSGPANFKPSSNYGPPLTGPANLKPSSNYGPPLSGPANLKPSSNYGPPLSAPSNNYGPPPSNSYGPPAPSNNYGPPISGPSQKPSNEYGPPPSAPPGNYGPPPSAPPGNYGPPPSAPPGNYGPPPSAPPGNYGPPPSGGGNGYLPPFPTPTASALSHNYDFPPSSISGFNSRPNHNSHTSFVTPVPKSVDKGQVQNSYGPPPAGPVQNGNIKITSDEYLPPPQELPISNSDDSNNYEALNVPPISQPDSSYNSPIVEPIPFPNMSPTFILPLKNAHPFRTISSPSAGDNLSSQGANIPVHIGNRGNIQSNVQITQSVPIADFLSTIEYPPNIVQAPLIDLIVNDNLAHDNNRDQRINLNDNPIVVDGDEHHQEASDNHASVAVHDAISTKLKFTPNILNTIEDTNPTEVSKTQEFKNVSVKTQVQIDPSLQTLLHDENLASIIAKQILSENKNPPKPFQASENTPQKSATQVNHNAQATNNALFTQPTIDYSSWNPSVGGLSTGMQPPAPSPSQPSWISTNNYVPYTTKKPKQIQIIVPYTTNNKGSNWHQKDSRKIPPPGSTSPPYNPTISLFGQLPSAEESQWTKYIDHNFQESKTNIAQTPSPISNIQDFFKDTTVNIDASQNLPFDILKLQKNIDVWTEQEFNKMRFDAQSSTTARFAYSKKIPDEYLTTQSINQAVNEVTTSSPNNRNSKLYHHDYLASSSVHHSVEAQPHNLTELAHIDNNLVDSSEKPSAVTPVSWDKIQVSISPVTNERVYVVTPLPWESGAPTPQSAWSYVPKNEIQQINKQLADNANFVFNSPRFAVRPEPVQMNKSKEDAHNKIHLVYSDWPELINSLATTAEGSAATVATPHPLLGRMDISEHTPAPAKEGTVQTYTGHSKVVTAVTASVAKKRTGIEDKKFTTTTKKTPTSDKA